jgi:hypothetical protein
MALGFLRGDGSGIDPNGNLVSATAGRGLRIRGGANARLVRGVLAAGTAVVANTSVTAATRVFVTHEGDGGAVGFLHSDPAANVPGVSFTVVSSNGADVGHFWALLVEVL